MIDRKIFFDKITAVSSFFYYWERSYSFFPKIWSYSFDGKWKMIFLKKIHGNMIYPSSVLKIWSFQNISPEHDLVCIIWKYGFRSWKLGTLSLDGKWKTVFLKKYVEKKSKMIAFRKNTPKGHWHPRLTCWHILLSSKKNPQKIGLKFDFFFFFNLFGWRYYTIYNEKPSTLCTIQPSGAVFCRVLERQSRKLFVH